MLVHHTKRCTEQPCQSITQSLPPLVNAESSQISTIGVERGNKARARSRCPIRDPGPQLPTGRHARFVWHPPRVVIPFTCVQGEMQFGDPIFPKDLSEGEREKGIVLGCARAVNQHSVRLLSQGCGDIQSSSPPSDSGFLGDVSSSVVVKENRAPILPSFRGRMTKSSSKCSDSVPGPA